MKKLLFWLGMMIGLLAAVVCLDKPPAKGQAESEAEAAEDWKVTLSLTDLSETDACDYEDLLVQKFNDEFDQGRAYILVQKGEIHEPGL